MALNTEEQGWSHEIMPATKDNIRDIVGLNGQFHLDIKGFKWDKPEWIKEEIEKGNYFVLKQGDKVIGAIDTQKLGSGDLYIEAIAVEPSQHGTGLGKRLIMFAKDMGQNLGCKKLTVESFQSYGLLDFYQKVGFKLDTPSIGYYEGKPFYRFVMHL